MSTPFLGQLLLCSWNFPAKGWALCNGQLMSIQQNAALFSLLGTYYGGNGIQNFALPNLQGRTPVGIGTAEGITIGQMAGTESVTLLSTEVPLHTHQVNATTSAPGTTSPSGALLARGTASVYAGATNLVAMNAASVSFMGGSQPHENRQPYLVMNWCIALSGIFPSQN